MSMDVYLRLYVIPAPSPPDQNCIWSPRVSQPRITSIRRLHAKATSQLLLILRRNALCTCHSFLQLEKDLSNASERTLWTPTMRQPPKITSPLSAPLKRLRIRKDQRSLLRHAIKNSLELSSIHELFSDENIKVIRIETKYVLRLFKRAIEKGNCELVQMILDKKPKIKDYYLTGDLLFRALDNDDLQMAELLIRAGTCVNSVNSEGMTLLHVLVSSEDCDRHDLAGLAIKLNANVNALDKRNRTSVLHEAIKSRCPTIVRHLIEFGADPRMQNSKGLTALFCAARSSDAAELLPAFVEGCGKKYLKERMATDALCYLVKMGRDKVPAMEAILEMGLPIDHGNRNGETPMNCAIRMNKINKVKLLLKYGADPNQRDKNGHRSLWVAASLSSSKISALLISHGAKIEILNKDLQLPIHAACKNSSLENIRLLLRNGADLKVANRKGETPFSMMKNPCNTEAGRLVIKQFAFSIFMEEEIPEMDLLALNSNPRAWNILEKSLQELEKMTEIEVCDGIYYYHFYTKSVKELSVLARNQTLVKNFYESYKIFPMIFPVMRFEMDMAMKRRDIFLNKEREMMEIFEGKLPCIFLRSLAEYLCYDELVLFDKNSYLLLV